MCSVSVRKKRSIKVKNCTISIDFDRHVESVRLASIYSLKL